MASGRPSRSLVVRLLQLIRDTSRQQRPLTVLELRAEFSREGWPLYDFRYYDNRFDSRLEEVIKQVLYELKDLGLVQAASFQTDTGFERWEAGEGWKLSIGTKGDGNSNDGAGGGGQGPRFPAGDDGTPDDDGAGGIREVLGHPLLFSLDEFAFDQLVEDLFTSEES